MFSSELKARSPSKDVNADSRAADLRAARRLRAESVVVGVDGGGTKTEAVIMDRRQQILGKGTAGPSNPLRVGVSQAATAVGEAIDRACAAANIRRSDIVAAEIGLAGVRRLELRERMRETFIDMGISDVEVVSDADIALYGATDGEPGVVVIAGTGSICCGINGRGKRTCAGGWGPIAGDEGGGSWIARSALRAVAQASDGRGPETMLVESAVAYFHVSTADDLSTAIYAPTMTNERLAGFAKDVILAARAKDPVARKIVAEAGRDLGLAAVAVIRKLKLERERFQVAYVGGVFTAAGEVVLTRMREVVAAVAPLAYFGEPRFSPAVAAARMAREHVNQMALAV